MAVAEVTVIMPVQNEGDFVGESLSAVLGQTMADLEVIVIDMGSADHTAGVLDYFRDPRLSIATHMFGGPVRALNRGVARSGGRYITWVSPRVVLLPRALQRMRKMLAGSPALGAVIADYAETDTDGNPMTAVSAGPFNPYRGRGLGKTFLLHRRAAETLGPLEEKNPEQAGNRYARRLGILYPVGWIREILSVHRAGDGL